MNRIVKVSLGVLLLSGMTAGGYWLGGRQTEGGGQQVAATTVARKVLYSRNPMGLPDTSPIPKRDAMGMDYVPVYEGDAKEQGGMVLNISLDKVQKLGVKSEAAMLRELNKTLRVTGRIEIDERRSYTIAPKFEGWVDRLYVNTTGQTVAKGEPLFDVYSPELVSAQSENALAKRGLAAMQGADDDAQKSMRRLADASATRLRNWDITDAQIQSGNGRSEVTFRAPVTGIVLEKKAIQGMRFMPGEVLYQIADLSSVWVIAEVPEQDIAQLRPGSRARVVVDAYPGRAFDGKVDFIYPTLDSATRTVQARMEVQNPQGLLKPAMFARVEMSAANHGKVLTVPTSAVIDSGIRQVVLVRLAEGRFEPRTVAIGSRGDDYVEVLSGVAEGEQVVTSANFLIDAESNLKAALGGMSHAHGGTPEKMQGDAPPAAEHAVHGAQDAAGQPEPAVVGHQAQGTLDAINTDGTVSITHGPIKTLGWPGMTMDFALANASLASGIKIGSAITFELVERKPGEWVVTRMQARPGESSSSRHGGH